MKRKVTLCILLSALILTSMASCAHAAKIFPLEGQEGANFAYTKEDEARYQAIYEGAYASASETERKYWEDQMQLNIDYYAEVDEKEYSNCPAVFTVPDEKAISREKAIYSAYAAMERLFSYTDEMLVDFYPICSYNIKDVENPSWYIVFDPVEKVQGFYYFCVSVNAWDGRILEIIDNSGIGVG